MKKVVLLFMAIVLVVGCLAGCGGKGNEGGKDGKKTLTIAFSYNEQMNAMHTWWENTQKLIEENNNNPDAPYKIEYLFTNADGDLQTQINDVESLIVRKPDVIMIKPVDSDGSVPAFEACMEAGIPVVNDGFTINTENLTSTFILMDHSVVGQMQAKWYENWLNEHPDETLNICYMQSEVSNHDMVVRRDAFYEYMNAHCADRINWLSEKAAGYDANEGAAITEDWLLSFPEVNAIVSPYDETAVAAAEVCKQNGRNDILICGVDGIEASVRAINEGIMAFSICINWNVAAEKSLELAVTIASGEGTPKELNASEWALSVIDSNNVAEYMAQYE